MESNLYLTKRGTKVYLLSRVYEDGTQVFTQEFPNGLSGCSTGDKDKVSVGYPRVRIPTSQEAPGLRFITPGGYMTGWTLFQHGSMESPTELPKFRDGEDGGIIILYQQEDPYLPNVMMSLLSDPMATNVWRNQNDSTLDWGVQGQAEDIPPGFYLEVMIQTNQYSINKNVLEWGRKVKAYHDSTKMPDESAKYLAYYTDNGAAHYYNPLPFANFGDLLLSIYNYTYVNDIPIRRLQLDSWWYHKGEGRGVKNWTALHLVFPDGIKYIHDITGWPIVAHNRYFSSDNDYAQQNGGIYSFAIDNETKKALPLEKVFWDDLFDEAMAWGMETYEQDWLDRQYMFTDVLHTNLTLGATWLNQMGQAAEERGLNIQYCMALTRQLLHSVKLPAVTQIRVSDDYILSPDQWRIGTTSLFAHALGLLPYKDVFWSSRENKDVVFNDCELILPDGILPPWDLQYQYGGRVNVSASGKTCVNWADFGYDDTHYGSGLALNLCKNPENERDGAFCYTKAGYDIPESEWEWEYCDVKICIVDCYLFNGYGIFYEGKHNVTQSGRVCVDWAGEFGIDGAKCRNPDNDIAPWCYVTVDHSERDYCDNKCPEALEYNSYLQGAVSSLSGGPVGVGDRAQNLNKDLLMKSCNADGLLLKPTKPLTVIDKYFISQDYKEVWTGYSNINNLNFGIIFLAEIENELILTSFDLNLEEALATKVLLWQNYPEGSLFTVLVNEGETLTLPSCGGFMNFCLFYTTPSLFTETGEIFLLGEKEKWTTVSPQRISNITGSGTSSTWYVTVDGIAGETVVISFYDTDVYDVTCNFSTSGTMTIDAVARVCS
ncbi:hypothetical protein SK128_010515 [Halocaridina rubra]|uniref:Kringle domain-containing protein n=1 Tax=Halocaridina rubra TaxID=373956 RepID=A0AAN9A782_HALRR